MHLRRLVLLRDQHQCQLRLPGCTVRATEIDHKVPLMHGGTDDLSNLQAACGHCNRGKGGVLLASNGTAVWMRRPHALPEMCVCWQCLLPLIGIMFLAPMESVHSASSAAADSQGGGR